MSPSIIVVEYFCKITKHETIQQGDNPWLALQAHVLQGYGIRLKG